MTLFVKESGNPQGPTIVFAHGVGTTGWMWQAQTAQLTDFHCLAVDLPGHGMSNALPWVSFAESAERLAAVIRSRANGGRAHVVGLSLGGYVVTQLLSQAPELVDHAVMSGVCVLPSLTLRLMKGMAPLLGALAQTDWMLRTNARMLKVPPELEADYLTQARLTSREAFVRANQDASDFVIPAGLARATCPTLVVAGQKEHPLIHRSLAALVETLPNADARLAPDVGHGWSGEAPELFATMLRAWFTDAPLPAALLPLPATLRAA